jgi:hypothetical protein
VTRKLSGVFVRFSLRRFIGGELNQKIAKYTQELENSNSKLKKISLGHNRM